MHPIHLTRRPQRPGRHRLACLIALSAALGALLAPGAASAQNTHRFDVFEYAIEGVSLLPEEKLERAVLPHLGEGKGIADVQAARQAVEEAYRAAGYLTVVVSIPNQPTDNGVIRLLVTEAEVERLRVKGSEYHLPSTIREKIPEFAEGKVPHFPTMQAQMSDLNSGGDLRVTPVLRAGKAPGTVEVDLEVEDKLPAHASFDWNNRYSANTTEQRVGITLRYDNLWQAGHSIGLTSIIAPERPSDTRVLALSYSLPIERDRLSFYAVRSRSALASLPGASALGTLGDADIVGLRWSRPLDRAGASGLYHTLTLGADWKDSRQSVTVDSGSIDTPVTYIPWSIAYSAAWSGDAGAQTTLDAGTVFSLRGAFRDNSDEFAARREGADSSFFILRLGASRQQPLGGGWQLFGKADGQLASMPLISTEQFVGTGAEAVRGYLESERLGDSGIRGTAELRTPAFNIIGTWNTPALFLDLAQVNIQQAVYPQKSSYRLGGAGLSLRTRAPWGFRLDTDFAFALYDGDVTRKGDFRVHARLLWDY